jgi:hypothetical protein
MQHGPLQPQQLFIRDSFTAAPTLTVIFLSQLQNDRFAALDDTKM